MVHCSRRGTEAIVGDLSHVFLFEQGKPKPKLNKTQKNSKTNDGITDTIYSRPYS